MTKTGTERKIQVDSSWCVYSGKINCIYISQILQWLNFFAVDDDDDGDGVLDEDEDDGDDEL